MHKIGKTRRKVTANLAKTSRFFRPSFSSAPKSIGDELDFCCEYLRFMTDHPFFQEIKLKVNYLYLLYDLICREGGLIKIVSENRLESVIAGLHKVEGNRKMPGLKGLTAATYDIFTRSAFDHYQKYLFQFEIVCKLEKRVPDNVLSNYKMHMTIPEKSIRETITLSPTEGGFARAQQLLAQDVVLLEGLCQEMLANSEIFSLQGICSFHKNCLVQVKMQESLQNYEYTANRKKTSQTHLTMILWEYYEYLQCQMNPQKQVSHKYSSLLNPSRAKPEQESDTNSNPNSDSQCKQAVETHKSTMTLKIDKFDPEDTEYLNKLYGSLYGTVLLYKSKYDILSYCDEDIIGSTIPVFQFRTKNSWSGAQQEVMCLTLVDINYGPGAVEWYVVPAGSVAKFQHSFEECTLQLMIGYGTDPMKDEGNWIQTLDWALQQGLPLKKVVQKKGDAIIIGPGSLYWTHSTGVSSHSKWNLMPKTIQQVQASTNRLNINKKQSLSAAVDVPIKSLFLQVCNHEHTTTDHQSEDCHASKQVIKAMRQSLKQWVSEEEKSLNHLMIKCMVGSQRFQYCQLFNSESYCFECNQQVLQYFLQYSLADDKGIICLECLKLKIQLAEKKKSQSRGEALKGYEKMKLILFYRYDRFHLEQLLHWNLIGGDNHHKCRDPEFTDLCPGNFIGNIAKCLHIQNDTELINQSPFEMINSSNMLIKMMSQIERLEDITHSYTFEQIKSSSNIQLIKKDGTFKTHKKQEIEMINKTTQTDSHHSKQSEQSFEKGVLCPPPAEKSGLLNLKNLEKFTHSESRSHKLEDGYEKSRIGSQLNCSENYHLAKHQRAKTLKDGFCDKRESYIPQSDSQRAPRKYIQANGHYLGAKYHQSGSSNQHQQDKGNNSRYHQERTKRGRQTYCHKESEHYNKLKKTHDDDHRSSKDRSYESRDSRNRYSQGNKINRDYKFSYMNYQ